MICLNYSLLSLLCRLKLLARGFQSSHIAFRTNPFIASNPPPPPASAGQRNGSSVDFLLTLLEQHEYQVFRHAWHQQSQCLSRRCVFSKTPVEVQRSRP